MTEANGLTTCDLCGASVAVPDRHADWHRELVTIDDIDTRIAKTLDALTERSQYNP